MSGKDEGGLFRRMARKVAAPARELVGLTPRDTEARATEFDKAEMKAMIERKRRNDYVRKRELDTLRRIRREGLSGDQAAALTMQSSRMDEAEMSRSSSSRMQTSGIKAKIDAIERQMVGANGAPAPSAAPRSARPPSILPPGPPPPLLTRTIDDDGAPTVAVGLSALEDHETAARLDSGPISLGSRTPPLPADAIDTLLATLPASHFQNTEVHDDRTAVPAPSPAPLAFEPLEFDMPSSPPPAAGPARVPATPSPRSSIDLGGGDRVEVNEVAHDEALDEAVIAFAGGDFLGCESTLQGLIGPRGGRRDHEETWLVVFDLYRAIGQQARFESLTMEYVERFQRSAPQWFSLPKLLAEATAAPDAEERLGGGIGWACPARLDAEAVNRLEALSMQLPSPWVMDWSALNDVDVEGAGRLCKLLSSWARQSISMQWVSGERLFTVLQELAPTGVRDADPVYWMLRLEALRLAHRPDQFDDAAIDYCVTFEVSPPSWENARCKAQLVGGGGRNTRTLTLSVVGEAVTSFMDTAMGEEDLPSAPVQVTSVELAGQLSGDLGELLGRLTAQVGESRVIRISCALLMRVDFVAAGDLLNWVAMRQSEGREIVFLETHRLVALMFGAMGINETARVQLRHA